MKDIDKLMAKMNSSKTPVEKPIEKPAEDVPQSPANVPQPAENVPQPAEKPINDTNDDTDEEDVEQIQTKKVDEHSIEQEIAVLQNDGIFRRELILTLKELTDVFKVNAQTLIEIKKKLLGEDDVVEKGD